MNHRALASITAMTGVMGLLAAAMTDAQARKPMPHAAGKQWELARGPDGHPDLQGFWANTSVTPLERPPELADKPFLTEQEALEWEQHTVERRQRRGDPDAHISPDATETWIEVGKVVPSRRTSLIVNPAEGRIPPLVPGRSAPEAPPRSLDNPEDLANGERCLVWGEDPPMVPSGIFGNLQVVQSPGFVVVVSEMIHNARIIPLDQRPHLPPGIRRWTGDSLGRWDGDTLVVDTTNFTNKTRFRGSTGTLHVVERFTRTDADTIRYEFTVEDPATWTSPWTAETALTRTNGPLFEYACHEGNYSMANILSGARAVEKNAVSKDR
jgi:hypothetical protein